MDFGESSLDEEGWLERGEAAGPEAGAFGFWNAELPGLDGKGVGGDVVGVQEMDAGVFVHYGVFDGYAGAGSEVEFCEEVAGFEHAIEALFVQESGCGQPAQRGGIV